MEKLNEKQRQEHDLIVLNSESYNADTREIILEMNLSPKETKNEAETALQDGEITHSDYYYILNNLNY